MWVISRGWLNAPTVRDSRLEQELFGVRFPNPLGLAAGFDKNAEAVGKWQSLGLGFSEIGTVTSRAQQGNPRPRLFRLAEDRALINRMGFNNEGASAVARRLAAAKPAIPIGVNLGKTRDVPLEQAAADHAESFRHLRPFGSYFVINVSSPNTPGLRSLQEKGPLTEIVTTLKEIDGTKPLFVKISPDLSTEALDDVLEVAHDQRLTGIIATNTTIGRKGLKSNVKQDGGLSGRPLFDLSNGLLSHLAASADKRMVLIGVGGIFSGGDLYTKISLGAHLCQIYTGFVYGGPKTAPRILREFLELMHKNDVASLEQLRGSTR
jgi:dihydroorotate dehydrogenase